MSFFIGDDGKKYNSTNNIVRAEYKDSFLSIKERNPNVRPKATNKDAYTKDTIIESICRFYATNQRIPTTKELKEVYQDLIIYNNDFKELWCLDENSGTLSVFDALSGVHKKCNTKEQLNQNRPLLAVCDVDYSVILDKELSINLNTSNEWGISIVYGCLGEQEYPDGFVKALNQLQLYNKSTWRLPSILELEQLYKHKELFNIQSELSIWSSTEPKKFFVNVLDFNSGEIKERKKTSYLNKITGGVILVSDE